MSESWKRTLLLWPMVVAIAVSYAVGEWYPLSSFPMYSKFDERTYYVYLTDADGEPVPTVNYQIVASDLKKHYGDALRRLEDRYKGSHYDWNLEQKQEAGEDVLRFLREEWLPQRAPDVLERGDDEGLSLVEVRVYYENGVFQRRVATVAGPAPQPAGSDAPPIRGEDRS